MAATMWRRGPDGHGIWTDGRAGLVSTRLAIIDLHERSNQPLQFGHLHLVFNGEIYNYRELREELGQLGHTFETKGDAEVLLHAWAEWGEACLDRLNGMFAFGIWDDARAALTLASDPFGEKPLYYVVGAGRILFASEIKALLCDRTIWREPNRSVLANFLARNEMAPVAESFFEGVHRLPASHILKYANGSARIERYWTPQLVQVPRDYPEAVTALRDLVVDSIRLRLRSDVPVGTSLSGGIDSSTIVMLSSQLAGDHTRHAFTATFPGFDRDEWKYAREVARRAGVVEHHAAAPTVDEVVTDLLALVVDHEEPVGSLSIYAQWRVMQAAKNAGVTVLLDGQGADELFGGYRATVGWALRSGMPRALPKELIANRRNAGALLKSLAVDHLPTKARRAHRRRVASRYVSATVVDEAVKAAILQPTPWLSKGSPLRRQLVEQSFETSLPHLLRYADRSSMAWSREVRLPYLDRRIAEFALSLPTSFLYDKSVTKRILRDIGRNLVPDSVLDRRDKVGFEPPQKAWLNDARLQNLIADVLLDPVAKGRDLYAAQTIEKDLKQGHWSDIHGIWRALNVELWLRQLVDSKRGLHNGDLRPSAA